MYKKTLIYSFFVLSLSFSLNGQDSEHVIKGEIDIKTIINPVDSTANFVIFKKNTIKYSQDNESFKERKFFINIPKGFNFALYKHKGIINTYVFSDNQKCIVIEIYPKKVEKIDLFSGVYKELSNSELRNRLQKSNKLEDDKYCGILSKTITFCIITMLTRMI